MIEKHYLSSLDQVVLKERPRTGNLQVPWQSCTAPDTSKFRPAFYQGPAQQGPWPGRAMGSWRAASQGTPGAGTNGPEMGPWVDGGGCSEPLRAIGALRTLTTQNWA